MVERYLNTNYIALEDFPLNKISGCKEAIEEIKAKELNKNTNKSTKFWLKVWQNWALAREYDIDILSC